MLALRKISSVLLAALMLVATTGVSIHKHYCMGQLRSVAIHTHAPNCFELAGQESESDMDCCENTSQVYQVDDEQQQQLTKIDLAGKYHLISAFLVVTVRELMLENGSEKQNRYLNYKPPLIAQDIPVTVQSFLL